MTSNTDGSYSEETEIKPEPVISQNSGNSSPSPLENPLAVYLSQPTSLSNTNPASWRRSDPVHAILHKRRILQTKFSVQSQNPRDKTSDSSFEIEETLARCQDEDSDYLPILQRACDAAAFSVVRALQKKLSSRSVTPDVKRGLQFEGLPPFLKELDQLKKAKKDALDIVSNKRKSDPSNMPNASGTTASTAASSKKQKQDKNLPIKKKKKDEEKQTDRKDAPMVQLAGYSNFDSRSTISRAILCAAASLAFKQLTPKFDHLPDINVLDVPQNEKRDEVDSAANENANTDDSDQEKNRKDEDDKVGERSDSKNKIDMGAITAAADIFAKRTVEQVRGAVLRGEKRRRWRSDCAKSDMARNDQKMGLSTDGILDQFFRWGTVVNGITDSEESSSTGDDVAENQLGADSSDDSLQGDSMPSEVWTVKCLPRITKIMNTGAGNLILHDVHWRTRANRVVELLKELAKDHISVRFGTDEAGHAVEPNYGPHLIVTTEKDLDMFMNSLGTLGPSLGAKRVRDAHCIRGLRYFGKKAHRRQMRVNHFTKIGLSGLPHSPFNVIVTTYKTLLKDYLHFCQIPFQSIILDDGMSWLGTAHYDPNGQLGKVFDLALWNKSDNHAGLAGVHDEKWNFALDISPDGKIATKSKDDAQPFSSSLTGLTARRRILLASSLHSRYREVKYSAPVPSLLAFLLPQFADVVREEWDRSRIHTCEPSMDHVRSLICRGIVVYNESNKIEDLSSLAMVSMTGTEFSKTDIDSYHHGFPMNKKLTISTDRLVSDGKIVQSRRLAASWLKIGSPIRQELGTSHLEPILNAIKAKANLYICEKIVPLSSIAMNSHGGAVSGPISFQTAVRCGRIFSSDQSMRQHLAAFHAPPGTWLCRSCSVDCGTSPARTQHERSCAQSASVGTTVAVKDKSVGGGIPAVGQNAKKKQNKPNPIPMEYKDQAGNLQVSTYQGVWVTPNGNFFAKLDEPLKKNGKITSIDSTTDFSFFDSADEAAKLYDEIKQQKKENSDLNFKPDGTRIVYDEVTNLASSGRGLEMLGGGASSVVPALSVINIKDLPKGVVPLLRDPKQTSRSGGNAKRFIYAYRGVCRQARKGHDRWQSQISFSGTNHYLGTFDSEWDAAAIYAWAHLILYGEEATQKAKKEGEEAVAAFEQEKKDIAAGKILAPTPQKASKPAQTKGKGSGQRGRRKKSVEQSLTDGQSSALTAEITKASTPKMGPDFQVCRTSQHESNLISGAIERILASQTHDIIEGSRSISIAGLHSIDFPPGNAAFIGLSYEVCQWSIDSFVKSMCQEDQVEWHDLLMAALTNENSLNGRFRSLMQRSPCFIGKAPSILEKASETLGFYGLDFGGTVGHIDCNIGGVEDSCSEIACCISYSKESKIFHFKVCGQDDIVSLNGFRVTPHMGSFSIRSGDVCSVGARVFMVILPSQ